MSGERHEREAALVYFSDAYLHVASQRQIERQRDALSQKRPETLAGRPVEFESDGVVGQALFGAVR